jgi:hypothetical protein
LVGSASAAPSYGENINARQAQLEQRIDFSQRSGRLNFAEARSLRDQMRHTSASSKRAAAKAA